MALSQNPHSTKIIFALLFALVVGNLIFLDLQSINRKESVVKEVKEQIVTVLTPPPSQEKIGTESQSGEKLLSCPQPCLETIKQATSAAKTPYPTAPVTTSSSGIKEFFIPLGSGSGYANDWQDVGGIQNTIDTNSYPPLKNAVFEVSVHVPTGNEIVYVRLYNATDNQPVWNSEVSYSGGTVSQLLFSGPINLGYGNKLYKVQIKTQLLFPATIDQARIHLTTY